MNFIKFFVKKLPFSDKLLNLLQQKIWNKN